MGFVCENTKSKISPSNNNNDHDVTGWGQYPSVNGCPARSWENPSSSGAAWTSTSWSKDVSFTPS